MEQEVYLDNSATTVCFPEVVELMQKIYLKAYGNPSSLHWKGVEAEDYVKEAREGIAKNLKVSAKEIIFTSGGTESDNTALFGVALANQRSGKHLITTKIEHPAVLQTMKALEEMGFEVTYLSVDEYGVISLEELKQAIRPDTTLVSIMHTNNEIGAVQPIAQAGECIKKINPKTVFHVDAVQGYGKYRIYPKQMKIDLMSVSGHKIHGPKGVGFLYCSEKVKMRPFMLGGGQQNGVRSGTENVPGIAGLGKAVELIYQKLDEDVDKLYALRDEFVEALERIPGVRINGHRGRQTAPHIVSASLQGVRAEVVLHGLEEKKIYVSSGSACASHKSSLSATLEAIHLPREYMDATLRFSFSVFTTKEELAYAAAELENLLPELRKYTRH